MAIAIRFFCLEDIQTESAWNLTKHSCRCSALKLGRLEQLQKRQKSFPGQ